MRWVEREKAAGVAERTAALLRIGAAVLEAYERRKRHAAALDFDDLIACSRRLLERNRHGGVGAVQARSADRSSSGRRRAGYQPRAVGDHRGAVRRVLHRCGRAAAVAYPVRGRRREAIDHERAGRGRRDVPSVPRGVRDQGPERSPPLARRAARPVLPLRQAHPRCGRRHIRGSRGAPRRGQRRRLARPRMRSDHDPRPGGGLAFDPGRAGAQGRRLAAAGPARGEDARGNPARPGDRRADLRVAARALPARVHAGADPPRRHHDPAAAPRHPPGAADQEPEAAAGAGGRRRPVGAHRRDRGHGSGRAGRRAAAARGRPESCRRAAQSAVRPVRGGAVRACARPRRDVFVRSVAVRARAAAVRRRLRAVARAAGAGGFPAAVRVLRAAAGRRRRPAAPARPARPRCGGADRSLSRPGARVRAEPSAINAGVPALAARRYDGADPRSGSAARRSPGADLPWRQGARGVDRVHRRCHFPAQ